MTTLGSGTRIRKDHTTFADVVDTKAINVTVTGDKLWTAPADGSEVKQGDKWLHVVQQSGLNGWMALIHKGVAYCKDFKEIAVEPPPPVSNDIDVQVTQSVSGSAVIITVGDETKPVNIVLNGHVVWNLPPANSVSG